MARAVKTIPRKYYKNPRPFQIPPDDIKRWATIDLSKSSASKMLLRQLTPALVTAERTAKIIGVNENYKALRAKGHFQNKYAMLVDGSPTRPLKNVSFLGTVIIQEEPSKGLIVEAATFVMNFLLQQARTFQKGTPPYLYIDNFRVVLEGGASEGEIAPGNIAGLMNSDADWRSITIYNATPYAGKMERYRKPSGVFRLAWNKVSNNNRFKSLGIKHFYMLSEMMAKSTTSHVKGQGRGTKSRSAGAGGRPIPVPAITIGFAGEVMNKAVRPGTTLAQRQAMAERRTP